MPERLKGSNLVSVKRKNRGLVLSLIEEKGPISRIDLANVTGLTQPAITNIVNDMINIGLVQEVGRDDTEAGRKPVLLALNPSRFLIVAVILDRTYFAVGLMRLDGAIIKSQTYFFAQDQSIDDLMAHLKIYIHQMVDEAKVMGKNLLGIGIGAPGPLDARQGIILRPPNFKGWHDIPIKTIIEKEFLLPVFLENTANAFALAEKHFGGGKGVSDYISVVVDDGIGAGVIMNDVLFRGGCGFGSEIGHTSIDPRGPCCDCGNIGCLELYASIPAIIKRARDKCPSAVPMTWKNLLEALQQGCAWAENILTETAEYIGTALIDAVNLYDPQVVFISGELAEAGEVLIRPVQKILDQRAIARHIHRIEVRLSGLKEPTELLGAGTIVLDKLFAGEIDLWS